MFSSKFPNCKLLFDYPNNENYREDGPNDAEDPNIDRIVTYPKEVGQPEQYLDAKVKTRIDNRIAGSDWRSVHALAPLSIHSIPQHHWIFSRASAAAWHLPKLARVST
jgi:hypothetical protein